MTLPQSEPYSLPVCDADTSSIYLRATLAGPTNHPKASDNTGAPHCVTHMLLQLGTSCSACSALYSTGPM